MENNLLVVIMCKILVLYETDITTSVVLLKLAKNIVYYWYSNGIKLYYMILKSLKLGVWSISIWYRSFS